MAMTSANTSVQVEVFNELLARFRNENPTFRIEDDVIRRYYLSQSTRGFVILCGPSGTGKTWLAQAYSNVIGARQKLVAVDPSWSSNEDLLGYLSPLDGFYHHTPFSEFVADSAREWNASNQAGRVAREFHVILDEMNLARVEHYFSRFLSAMEVRTREGIARLDLAPGHTVELTPNLKFAGTVNIDETTHGFADKVYDRAQILELPLPRAQVALHMKGYLWADTVMEIWDALAGVAPFGFRVLDEINAYVIAATEIGTSATHALDEQLIQKVLPRLRGDASAAPAIDAFIALTDGKYPLANTKARAMRAELNAHGFVSYF
jgi:dynein-related subfamily AAA family protein